MITSLFDIDRAVREATLRLSRARLALPAHDPSDDPPPNPLAPFRELLSRATHHELADVPDPLLAPALRRHVAKLTLSRVLWDDEVRVARAWAEPSIWLDDGVRIGRAGTKSAPSAPAAEGPVPPRALFFSVLADPDDLRRAKVAEALVRAARERLRDPVRVHAERRALAASQLGVSLDDLDLPAPSDVIDAAASELLTATQPIAERFAPWDRGLARSMAHDAVHGWPARLAPRWVLSIFAGTELGDGGPLTSGSSRGSTPGSPSVRPFEHVRLPVVLGGASFARALRVFGEAFGEACAPAGLPFALACPLVDLRPLRIGALFAGLVADPVFARRTLALSPGAARDHARRFARAVAAHLRLTAALVRTRRALLPPRDDLDHVFCDETARAWGEPVPPALAAVLPSLTAATPARFVATLLAALDRAHLIETFDDDWHKNPRSIEALRALASAPEPPLTAALLQRASAELARVLLQHA